jgi:hypothetical protein
MHNRTLTYVGSTFGTMVAIYIALVIGTIFLANWQTEMAGRVSDSEAAIGALEMQYYQAIAEVNAQDPSVYGFITPTKKAFARAATAEPTLTRADN